MTLRSKNIVYSLLLAGAVFAVWKYRQKESPDAVLVEGETMGTTYHITYFDDQKRDFKTAVDSLLQVFNQSLSTYLSHSEISTFNQAPALRYTLPYFYPVLQKAAEVYTNSGGAFDPTVMPLVDAWGFGPGEKLRPDSVQIDSILTFVGFDKVHFNPDSLWKDDPRVQLDFSAIAKGYGVDVVAGFVRSKGITDGMVEIGGEVVAWGKNNKQKRPWSVGILDPASDYVNTKYLALVSLKDKAVATSGNYFNQYVEDGIRYTHTIDPATGYPIQQEILSASVFAGNCMTADAWATAFMVMGHKRAIETLQRHPELDALLVYSAGGQQKTYMTQRIAPLIRINP